MHAYIIFGGLGISLCIPAFLILQIDQHYRTCPVLPHPHTYKDSHTFHYGSEFKAGLSGTVGAMLDYFISTAAGLAALQVILTAV